MSSCRRCSPRAVTRSGCSRRSSATTARTSSWASACSSISTASCSMCAASGSDPTSGSAAEPSFFLASELAHARSLAPEVWSHANLLNPPRPNLNNSTPQTDTQAVRSKVSRPALVGGRCNRLGYLAAMRKRQPRGQLAGRLLWGLAVEGHHRGGHPGFPRQLSAPPVADRRHVDLVRTPTYRFFEVVNDHLSGGSTDYAGMSGWDQTLTNQSGAPVILRGRYGRSSEGKREGVVHSPSLLRSLPDPIKEKSASSGCPQDFHAPSTGFPQLGSVRLKRSALASGM